MRIKVTGYIDVDDLGPGDHDPDDPSGLTADAYERLTGVTADAPFVLGDLYDLDLTVEDDQ